jgi:hypothetical protein
LHAGGRRFDSVHLHHEWRFAKVVVVVVVVVVVALFFYIECVGLGVRSSAAPRREGVAIESRVRSCARVFFESYRGDGFKKHKGSVRY